MVPNADRDDLAERQVGGNCLARVPNAYPPSGASMPWSRIFAGARSRRTVSFNAMGPGAAWPISEILVHIANPGLVRRAQTRREGIQHSDSA